jgi:ribosome-associated protein
MAKKSPVFDDIEEEEIEWVSKTQFKKHAKDLKNLGEEIVKLSPAQRAKLPLDDEMKHALMTADKIRNTREGYRRQLQFIGRLLRHRDAEAIQLAMDGLTNTNKQAEKALQQLEKIRTELLEQGDKRVNALVAEHPDFERQKLRQLVKKTLKQQQQQPEQVSPAFRDLFQYLKEVIK